MNDPDLPEHTERDRVHAWRVEELERAGYPPVTACLLAARADIDLHQAVALLRAGCPPDRAEAILL